MSTQGLSLDAGALIAIERGDGSVRALIREATHRGLEVAVVAGVVAQTWRGGPRQARLAAFLGTDEVEVISLGEVQARATGILCGTSGHHDIVDVHVVLQARLADHAIVTSDPDDLRKVDPTIRLIQV